MADVPPWFEIVYTPEEERYEKRLAEVATAALGKDWRQCWPDHEWQKRPVGSLDSVFPFGSVNKLIERTNERITGTPAACYAENINLPWCVRMGAAWKMDPSFFVNHVRPLDAEEAHASLREARMPNSDGGLHSSSDASVWATVRGHTDHGKPRKCLAEYDFFDYTRRQHHIGKHGRRKAHTNISIYKVEADLHVILVDRIPQWQAEYVLLDTLRWFPNQIIVRLATLKSPGYLTIPNFKHCDETGVIPFWTFLRDAEDKELLLQPLQTMDVDEFLYRVAVLYCEEELNCLVSIVHRTNLAQSERLSGQGPQDDAAYCALELGHIEIDQKNLRRVKACICENLAYERQVGKTKGVQTACSEDPCSFERLASDAVELEHLLAATWYRTDQEKRKAQKSAMAGREWSRHILSVALVAVPVVCAAVIVSVRMRKALRT